MHSCHKDCVYLECIFKVDRTHFNDPRCHELIRHSYVELLEFALKYFSSIGVNEISLYAVGQGDGCSWGSDLTLTSFPAVRKD
mgnify:FL=1